MKDVLVLDPSGAVALGFRCGFSRWFFPCSAGNPTYPLAHGLDKAMQARLAVSRVLAKHGFTDDVPMPDISTKEKAQQYIGLDMDAERAAKEKFLKTTVPAWLEKAKANGRLAQK